MKLVNGSRLYDNESLREMDSCSLKINGLRQSHLLVSYFAHVNLEGSPIVLRLETNKVIQGCNMHTRGTVEIFDF